MGVGRSNACSSQPSFLETTDESFVRNRYARRRPRAGPCRHRPGPAAERQAYDQGTENDDGAHGEEQPRDVLRSRRARQERLRRGPTFLRRAGDARPRAGFVRACSERRLPEIGGRQNQSLVIPAAAGIGLRFPHHRAVLEEKPPAAWLEVHVENYMGGGKPLMVLDALRRDYPLSLHGVGLSLGSADGLNEPHLVRLRDLAPRVDPGLVSEHLSWSAAGATHFADLLPLPLTEESLALVCRNVEAAQDFLGRRILVENASSYLRYRHSTIPEWEFVAALAGQTGCGILCDVNNVFVSACNHGFNPRRYLHALPAERVSEIHLAGHQVRYFEDGRSIRIDDHGSRVSPEGWGLYAQAPPVFGPGPTPIEWDTDVPPPPGLLDEAAQAQCIMSEERKHARVA